MPLSKRLPLSRVFCRITPRPDERVLSQMVDDHCGSQAVSQSGRRECENLAVPGPMSAAQAELPSGIVTYRSLITSSTVLPRVWPEINSVQASRTLASG